MLESEGGARSLEAAKGRQLDAVELTVGYEEDQFVNLQVEEEIIALEAQNISLRNDRGWGLRYGGSGGEGRSRRGRRRCARQWKRQDRKWDTRT